MNLQYPDEFPQALGRDSGNTRLTRPMISDNMRYRFIYVATIYFLCFRIIKKITIQVYQLTFTIGAIIDIIMSDTNADNLASYINDVRNPGDFVGISFSKYSRTAVKKELTESILKGKIEPACNWSAELICAGHYGDLWEVILHIIGKYIHIGNPRIAIYVELRYNVFKAIISQGFFVNELHVRNNDNIRKLFAELISILALSEKNHSFEPIKINREDEFDTSNMHEKLKAPHTRFAESIFRKEDPKELYVAINEFAFCISHENPNPNLMSACYWIEWIIEFDILCKNRGMRCVCERRVEAVVDSKFQKDIIWLVWNTLLVNAANKGGIVEKTIQSLMTLFCIKYTPSSNKKRRYILYFATNLLTEHIRDTVGIIRDVDRPIIESVTSQINRVYKAIKKNEETPGTDYLFMNMNEKQSNFDKSVKKLEMMNAMDL